MSTETTFSITREKHLDHLVKVVPFIVLFYGIQSYMLLQLEGPFGTELVFGLGSALIFMILVFVYHDINHKVTLHEKHLEIGFNLQRSIQYSDILLVEISDPKETFGTVTLITKMGTIRFYFVDDVDKIKQWIDTRRISSHKVAA